MTKELLIQVREDLKKEFEKETIDVELLVNPESFQQEILTKVSGKVFSSRYSWEDIADMTISGKDTRKLLKEDLANSIKAIIETRSENNA